MRAHPIRQCAEKIIGTAPGAPVKCDRGGFLYVSGAAACAPALREAEFAVVERNGRLYLSPGEPWVGRFLEWAASLAAPGELSKSLDRLRGREMCECERALWIDGIKLVELGAAAGAREAYDRRVRQAAAVCLRTQKGGGLLMACAACLDLMEV